MSQLTILFINVPKLLLVKVILSFILYKINFYDSKYRIINFYLKLDKNQHLKC
jgi:hypothetical protein